MGYYADLSLLERYGIEIAKTISINKRWKEGLEEASKKLGFPFVAKVEASKPIHKTELGGVKIIEDRADIGGFLENAERINKRVKITGLIAQEKLTGMEVFIGGKRDPQFGPIVLFGLGGIFVEIIEDISIRLCPLTKKDAEQMIREIKGYPALSGARGTKPVNLKKLVNAIIGVSKLMIENPDIREIDINPLFANNKYVKAADVRIIRDKGIKAGGMVKVSRKGRSGGR